MKYVFTAVFTTDESGKVYAKVPDLKGCITTGDSIEDAIDMVTDAVNLWLVTAEDEGYAIPAPTPQLSIQHDKDATFSLIQADTIKYRKETDTKAVRKNVSLPAWMFKMADKLNVNCSQVLQDSLLNIFEASK